MITMSDDAVASASWCSCCGIVHIDEIIQNKEIGLLASL